MPAYTIIQNLNKRLASTSTCASSSSISKFQQITPSENAPWLWREAYQHFLGLNSSRILLQFHHCHSSAPPLLMHANPNTRFMELNQGAQFSPLLGLVFPQENCEQPCLIINEACACRGTPLDIKSSVFSKGTQQMSVEIKLRFHLLNQFHQIRILTADKVHVHG